MMKLNRENIEEKLGAYLAQVRSIEIPVLSRDPLVAMRSLKRDKIGSGPYQGVSLFEVANRVLSDLVILYGVQRLLDDPVIGSVQLPFQEYEAALGVKGGYDLEASADGQTLIGEAFNVAPSFFQAKRSAMIKKLQREPADYRLILFNSDAVSNPRYYLSKSEPAMLYLPVGIPSQQP